MTHSTRLLLLALLSTGCGFADPDPTPTPEVAFAQDRSDDGIAASLSRSSYGRTAIDASDLEAAHHGAHLIVAPDRALVRVDVTVEATTRGAAVARARDVATGVATGLSEGDGCDAAIVRYGMPSRTGEQWRDQATVRLDIPLAGIDDVGERLARVEACMARFSALGAHLGSADIAVSAPLPTIDHPEAHRAALLERRLTALRDVAALDGPAAFDGEGMRCVSAGGVTIVERGLHGVALDVDLQCTPRPIAPVAPAT